MMPCFEHGEPWKKVYGPVFIYLNSTANGDDPLWLWDDAKIKVREKQIAIGLAEYKNKFVVMDSPK